MKHTPRLDCAVPELVVRQSDLPLLVRVLDDQGNSIDYSLNPAGKKKLGACLAKVPEHLRAMFTRR